AGSVTAPGLFIVARKSAMMLGRIDPTANSLHLSRLRAGQSHMAKELRRPGQAQRSGAQIRDP
ncbi:hypothetical protein, partial [Bradyrhizobium uaiense]|uniref:hypothetical protein n=1 Tax=Bradyrhizobium uaiense TaxID=2594946 RepID=UPI0019D57A0E